VQKFTDLRVWQAARALAGCVYRATNRLPREERFGLCAQLRRASVSVLTNIAEGAKREHRNDYAHFLNIAEGSLAEIQCLLVLCGDLGFLLDPHSELRTEADRTARMVTALRKAVLRRTESRR